MKAYELKKACVNLDGLRLVDRPRPEPGPEQILVRMRAASLNYRDQAIVAGIYGGGAVSRDTIALSDGAGEVMAVGPQVTRFKIGDRVAGTFFRGWIDGPLVANLPALGSPIDGVLCEYAAFDQNDAVLVPEHLGFEEASTLPCAGVTAWNALMVACGLRPGHTVLVLGTGGVSLMALQFARAAGARAILTSSSDDKIAKARLLGAAEAVNYAHHPDWDKKVLAMTDGKGVDCVVEVGGPGTLTRSMASVGYGGKIALIGVLTGTKSDANPFSIMRKGASLHGIFVGSRTMFENMNAAIEINQIHPVVDRVFAFDEVPEAYRYQKSGAHFGKVVIRI
jgi:NADPH:quinone reductase-like Zn-dependent oxidoreductase